MRTRLTMPAMAVATAMRGGPGLDFTGADSLALAGTTPHPRDREKIVALNVGHP